MTSMQLVLHNPDQAPILPDDAFDFNRLARVSFRNALKLGNFLSQQDQRSLRRPSPGIEHVEVRADGFDGQLNSFISFCGCHGRELTPSLAEGDKP